MQNIYQTTHKIIEDVFRSGWQDLTPAKYENRLFQQPIPPWVEIAISWGSGLQSEIEPDWQNNQIGGVIYVQVHVPLNEGVDDANRLVGRVLDVIAHKKLHHGNTLVTTFGGCIASTRPEFSDFRLLCKCQFIGETSDNSPS